ncbi:MAG: phenylalanine--tRNA ligase subunit beta [Candidatus Thermoplasmatota archaeon]|nr:phenylalanine--tRNA ligase subunit beta [Candidatus Thermoplasmatota archaeon]
MPVITFDYDDLISLMGRKIERDELLQKIPMIGAEIDRVEDGSISVEFFPDRPDLLSVEGIARAMRSFLGIEKGMKKYGVMKPSISLKVNEGIKKVRPLISAAAVRNVKMNENFIVSMMELQEKLHFSIGKDRKKMAIGLHNLDAVTPPFAYMAVKPDEVEFIPLGESREMNLDEILQRHDKGIKYAHLLKDYSTYPIVLDKNGNVLSFPPIINGELTAVDLFTENLFVDVTGTEEKAVDNALNIITAALAERGGTVEMVEVVDEKIRNTPDFSPASSEVDVRYATKILGFDVKKHAVDALEKMGFDARLEGNSIKVAVPPWRVDILHPVDIVEDIAIGYGYDKFSSQLPRSMTFGKCISWEKIHEAMIGMKFNEVVTISLSNEEDQFKKMNIEPREIVGIENPISSKHSCVRVSLLPSLMEILSKNRHNDLPQMVYEIGDVVEMLDGIPFNKMMVSGVKIDAKTGFTECKSIVEALLRSMGAKAQVQEKRHGAFIEGRCASLTKDGEIGYFGEIHPSVISNFDLEYPVIAFELSAERLLSISENK